MFTDTIATVYTYNGDKCTGNYVSSKEYALETDCTTADDGDDFMNGGIGYSIFSCEAESASEDSSSGAAAVAGIACGGFVIIAAIVFGLLFWLGYCSCCTKDSMKQSFV